MIFIHILLLPLILTCLANKVIADQAKNHIGVTRAELVSFYSDPSMGFVFGKESNLIDGRPRIQGECGDCPDGHLTLEFVGPARGYLQIASATFAAPRTSDFSYRFRGVLTLNTLLMQIFPRWRNESPTSTDWMEKAIQSETDTVTYRNGLRVKLGVLVLMDGKFYILTIDSN